MTEQSSMAVRRALSVQEKYGRRLAFATAFRWLRAGVQDTCASPFSSLCYGLAIFLLSVVVIWALVVFEFSYILLPAVAGFLVVGPMLAIGLYEKSRLLAAGTPDVGIAEMLRAKPKSRGELLILGVILLLVLLFWLRTAILLYALFFGLQPFEGIEKTIEILLLSERGQTLLLVGTIVGGMFAALAFSVSAFSVPMLMNEKKDTITAMVISLVSAWTNKPVAIVWGMIVSAGFLLSLLSGLVGLIVIFPILGHATWHAYIDIRGAEALKKAEDASHP